MPQYEPPFPPVTKRRSATAEELATRQTQDYPPASPHRVGHTPGLHGEDAPYLSQQIIRPGQRRTIEEDQEDAYAYADSPRRGKTTQRVYPPVKPTRQLKRTRFHWLVFVGIGLFVMILGWLSFSALSSWWSVTQDDWHYGRPRTYQTDAIVGHEDSRPHPSHFIALNLNGKISVVEIPGGDTAHSQIYNAPTLFGAGQDLVPVTLSFDDCNGDGKPDLNIHIVGSDKIICFPNNGKTFDTQQQQQ